MINSWVGYTGGDRDGAPSSAGLPLTYEYVCSQRNTHTEAIRLEFDPTILSYEALVRRITQDARVQRLRPTNGTSMAGESTLLCRAQTRIAIWARDGVQTRTAKAVLAEAGMAELVPVLPPSAWHLAEEYHQHFVRDDKPFPDWSENEGGDSLGGPGTAWGL